MTEPNRHRILGAISGSDYEDQFYRKFVAELARRLAQFKAVRATRPGVASCDEVQAIGPLQPFLFFLTRGCLPWWGAKPSEGWSDALLATLDIVGWTALHGCVLADPHAGVRLIDSVDDQFLEAAVVNWTGTSGAIHVLAQLKPNGLQSTALRQWRRRFWALLLDWALLQEPGSRRGAELMRNLLQLGDEFVTANTRNERPPDSEEPADSAQPDARSSLPEPWRTWRTQSDLSEID